MKRLIEKTVFSGFVTAWRFATWPTRRSPFLAKQPTAGVIRLPSAFTMTFGSLPSMTATTELVVPRSMPMILDILFSFYDLGGYECPIVNFVYRSKPESIIVNSEPASYVPPRSADILSAVAGRPGRLLKSAQPRNARPRERGHPRSLQCTTTLLSLCSIRRFDYKWIHISSKIPPGSAPARSRWRPASVLFSARFMDGCSVV